LKSRTAPKVEEHKKDAAPKLNPFGGAAPVETKEKPADDESKSKVQGAAKEGSEPVLAEEKDTTENPAIESKTVEDDRKRREPDILNSRAAMFGDAPDTRRDVSAEIADSTLVSILALIFIGMYPARL